MGTDTTSRLQNFTAQSPQDLSVRPDLAQQQMAMGMSPGQVPTSNGLNPQAMQMGQGPTPGYLPSGKNQLAPGTPGSSLQGPAALPGQGNPQTPAQNNGIKMRIAQLLQNLKLGRTGQQPPAPPVVQQ